MAYSRHIHSEFHDYSSHWARKEYIACDRMFGGQWASGSEMTCMYHSLKGSPRSRMLQCDYKNQEWQGQSPGLTEENNPFEPASKATVHGRWVAGSAIAAASAPSAPNPT